MVASHDTSPGAPTTPGDRLMAEAEAIIEAARRQDARLRLTGGLAVRRYATDLGFMEREFSDIDFVGRSGESRGLRRAFERLGYEENGHVSQATAGVQLQYVARGAVAASRVHEVERLHAPRDHVDVFLDVMRMDHDVDLRGRLEIDPFAISPADVLLTKLQMGGPAWKDVHDVIALLKDVPLGQTDDGATIDITRVARACARDWGMWYDVTANLRVVAVRVEEFALSDVERMRVLHGVAALESVIAAQDKSLRFRLRAHAGTRLPWRREVEEREGPPAEPAAA